MRGCPTLKRCLFACALIAASLVVIESALHLVYLAAKRSVFPFGDFRFAMARAAAGGDEFTERPDARAGEFLIGDAHEVIHPYLGFVDDPLRTPDTSYLGFPGKGDDPFAARPEHTVRIGVFGGSFARGVAMEGRAVMQQTLEEGGIESEVINLAMGGYKQPQQLALLTWLLSRGAVIDVVLNIDGFNEVALPPVENMSMGVNPFYPRAWYHRVQGVYDRGTLRLVGRGALLVSWRRKWASIFDQILPWSITLNVIWRAGDRGIEKEIEHVQMELAAHKADASRFIASGDDPRIADGRLYEELAEHWRGCSELMETLCKSRGIVYVHCLQPNQYHEAGRVLTPEERDTAFQEDHMYRPGVVQGYPLLLREGKALLSAGVDFHDLTLIYRDEAEPIYRDACCHPNQLGYDLVAEYAATPSQIG